MFARASRHGTVVQRLPRVCASGAVYLVRTWAEPRTEAADLHRGVAGDRPVCAGRRRNGPHCSVGLHLRCGRPKMRGGDSPICAPASSIAACRQRTVDDACVFHCATPFVASFSACRNSRLDVFVVQDEQGHSFGGRGVDREVDPVRGNWPIRCFLSGGCWHAGR